MSAYRARPRPRGQSYTDRLRQRSAARPVVRPVVRPAPAYRGRRGAGPLLAPLALGAELGHLVSAVVEWPGAAARGVFHVVAAAVLGLVTVALLFGASRRELGAGAAVTLVVPGGWLVGALLGASPYHGVPLPAAAALAGLEVIVVALVAAAWWGDRPGPARRAIDRNGPARRATDRRSGTTAVTR